MIFFYLHSIEYSKGHCFFIFLFTQKHTNFRHKRHLIYESISFDTNEIKDCRFNCKDLFSYMIDVSI